MEQTNNNKKTGLFIAIAIIAEYLLRLCVNTILMHTIAISDTSDYERYNMISRIASLCITAVTIIITFAVGYALTKNKKKAVIFAGSVYFGRRAAGLIESLIGAVANSLGYAAVISASEVSTVIMIGRIITIPPIIAAAYFAFTAFEGTNPKLEGSLDSSEMLLLKARKRLIVAYLFSAVVTGIITSAPSLIFAFINIDMEYPYIMSVLSSVMTWFSSVLSFVIVYFAGYKPYKSHCDAMAFLSSAGVSIAISGFFTAVAMLPVSALLQAATKAENYQQMALLTGVTTAVSGIAFIIEIVLVIYMTKFFFAPAKITLFSTENEAYGPAELTYEAEADSETEPVEALGGEPEPYQLPESDTDE